jgi:hypothetical protein
LPLRIPITSTPSNSAFTKDARRHSTRGDVAAMRTAAQHAHVAVTARHRQAAKAAAAVRSRAAQIRVPTVPAARAATVPTASRPSIATRAATAAPNVAKPPARRVVQGTRARSVGNSSANVNPAGIMVRVTVGVLFGTATGSGTIMGVGAGGARQTGNAVPPMRQLE